MLNKYDNIWKMDRSEMIIDDFPPFPSFIARKVPDFQTNPVNICVEDADGGFENEGIRGVFLCPLRGSIRRYDYQILPVWYRMGLAGNSGFEGI